MRSRGAPTRRSARPPTRSAPGASTCTGRSRPTAPRTPRTCSRTTATTPTRPATRSSLAPWPRPRCPLGLAQPDPVHRVVRALAEHERRPPARGEHVLDEVHLVDVPPDPFRRPDRLLVAEVGVPVEVRRRVREGRTSQPEEPVDVPAPDVLHL